MELSREEVVTIYGALAEKMSDTKKELVVCRSHGVDGTCYVNEIHVLQLLQDKLIDYLCERGL